MLPVWFGYGALFPVLLSCESTGHSLSEKLSAQGLRAAHADNLHLCLGRCAVGIPLMMHCLMMMYWGSVSAPGTRRAFFFYHSPLVPVFAPTSPNNLEYLLAVSKNLAHPLHPVYDDGKGGVWKWWE